MAKELAVYMATHSNKCSHINNMDFIVPIQVGRSLNDVQIEKVTDDSGKKNISYKNEVYCELTAMYWMWKNDQSSYIGLYHYRRRFNISKQDILRELKYNDVILPAKKLFRISLADQYIKEHNEDDWKELIDVIHELYPEYYDSSCTVFNENILYRFNMFIMDREKFHSYCEWLFPILSRIEEKVILENKDRYQKRYIGFMAERLFTLYVLHNNFKIYESNILFNNKKVKLHNTKNMINNIIYKCFKR